MCVGQQLKNKTAKQSIHSQPFLDFLGEVTVLRGGHVSHLPNDNNNISHSHSEIWGVNSFNPLDYPLLMFFTILSLLQVKLNPLLINEKYQVLFPTLMIVLAQEVHASLLRISLPSSSLSPPFMWSFLVLLWGRELNPV